MAKSVFENFVNNPDCDICGDGSCTCGESQEIDEKLNEMDPANMFRKMMRLECLCLQ